MFVCVFAFFDFFETIALDKRDISIYNWRALIAIEFIYAFLFATDAPKPIERDTQSIFVFLFRY